MNLVHFLGLCALANYAILSFWFLIFVTARGWLQRFHTLWFRLSPEQFDAIHYAGMAFYKITVLIFFVVPYLVLRYTSHPV
ncbi:hypothetical protein ABS71_16450 [bacterium SCN 62-11]|nr:hypothetical protein [Candidatus Eremiobacteraeota bacterium]ODT61959.1 MAG: hypothetical protein ABS71_16450 [bacterium SCN 62-11]